MLTSRRAHVGALGLLLAAAMTAVIPGQAHAATSASRQAGSPSGAYATALNYVVRFYPRWFTYKQARTLNRLIAPRRISQVYKAVVAINDDTLYASGFLDVAAQPVILTIPKTTVTYSLLVLDAYGNIVQTNIAAQTPGTYALTGPGWAGTLPAGVTKVPLPVTFVNAIIRADKYSNGVNEIPQAEQFRRSLRVQPVSQYLEDPAGGATQVLPERYFSVSFKRIAEIETTRTPIVFLRQLQAAMHDPHTPPLSPADQRLSNRFDTLFGSGTRIAPSVRAQFARGVRVAHAAIIYRYHSHTIGRSHWITFSNIGHWGYRYLDRDAITEYIQFGNARSTAAYYHTFEDRSGAPLDGIRGRGYILTFQKNQLPQAKRFWSLTAYLPGTIELVPNLARKYLVASYTPGLKTNRNGSISIYLTVKRPAGVPSANWLPVPRGRFNAMLRVYGPQGRVANNTYIPPAIQKLH